MLGLRLPINTSEHTDSYYAATCEGTSYPSLAGDLTTDVAIVGGGFSGINTALELSERGVDVIVLEANRIAWGATGRNGGQVIGGLGHEPENFHRALGSDGVELLLDLGDECVEIIRQRVQQYDIDCDLAWGYCEVALKQRHLRWLKESEKESRDRAYAHDLQLLSKDELKGLVGSDAYLGGLYNANGAGHLHPLKLCLGEATAAVENGARVFEDSRVIAVEHGATARVFTSQGSVSARHIVFCGNGYLDNLAPRLASRIIPASSCIIATAPLSKDLAASVLPQNTAVCDLRTALDYYRLTADRRMLFGGLSNYTGLVPTNYREVMQRKMLKIFPQLQGIEIDYAWDGQMAIGMNRMPQTGRIGSDSYFIQAFSGHGVAPTHVMARLVAEAICGESNRFDVLAGIRHWPFPGGRYLRRPAMALGMLYYKALDYL